METLLILHFLATFLSPHSLGTLIEWKRHDIECLSYKIVHLSHSLGILIEWKQRPSAVYINT